jgi:hypothetical protein
MMESGVHAAVQSSNHFQIVLKCLAGELQICGASQAFFRHARDLTLWFLVHWVVALKVTGG